MIHNNNNIRIAKECKFLAWQTCFHSSTIASDSSRDMNVDKGDGVDLSTTRPVLPLLFDIEYFSEVPHLYTLTCWLKFFPQLAWMHSTGHSRGLCIACTPLYFAHNGLELTLYLQDVQCTGILSKENTLMETRACVPRQTRVQL